MNQLQMPVSLYMSAPVVAVAGDQPLDEAYRAITERSISCVPVLDSNGLPVGVLSRTDLLRIGHVENKTRPREVLMTLPDEPARNHMPVGVYTVTPDTQVAQAAHVLLRHRIHRVFVEDEGRLVGVFSTKEILVAIWDARATRARRVLAIEDRQVVGVLTGLDFARAVA